MPKVEALLVNLPYSGGYYEADRIFDVASEVAYNHPASSDNDRIKAIAGEIPVHVPPCVVGTRLQQIGQKYQGVSERDGACLSFENNPLLGGLDEIPYYGD